MLTITETAGAIISSTLENRRKTEDDVFRVMYSGSDLSLSMGERQEGDVVILHENRPILVLESSVADALQDVTVDTDEEDRSRLVIRPAAGEAV